MTNVHGVSVPDSKLCRTITESIPDTETELLFNHSSRVYFFGAIAGQQRGLTFTPSCSTRRPCSTTSG
jgi:hypothetical protein